MAAIADSVVASVLWLKLMLLKLILLLKLVSFVDRFCCALTVIHVIAEAVDSIRSEHHVHGWHIGRIHMHTMVVCCCHTSANFDIKPWVPWGN